MFKTMCVLLSLMIGLVFHSISIAEESSEKNYISGWHWYNEPKLNTEDDDSEENEASSPVAQMNIVKTKIQNALDKAIVYPNSENVKNYIDLQNQLMSQSRKFSHYWQAELLHFPELDYSLAHPTNNSAKQVENDQEEWKENAIIRDLSERSGLVFFYRSTCPYCQRFAPILKDFAVDNNLKVIPITTDGIALPEFPKSLPNRGQAEKFHVTVEPALFVVNPYTHQAFPLAYGLTSEADLKKRLLQIATHYEGDVA